MKVRAANDRKICLIGVKELAQNTLVWYKMGPRLFLPGAVIESSDPKSMTLLAFDIERPANQCKYQRNRVIAAFHHELNLELLVERDWCTISYIYGWRDFIFFFSWNVFCYWVTQTFGRNNKNKAADRKKLNIFFDHASRFFELRNKPNFTQLTARQYLMSCYRCTVHRKHFRVSFNGPSLKKF